MILDELNSLSLYIISTNKNTIPTKHFKIRCQKRYFFHDNGSSTSIENEKDRNFN